MSEFSLQRPVHNRTPPCPKEGATRGAAKGATKGAAGRLGMRVSYYGPAVAQVKNENWNELRRMMGAAQRLRQNRR